MDSAVSRNDILSPQQAADVLGCSPRTVRRAIEGGRLVGTLHPCQTTKEACDAYRQRQQGLAGEVVAGSDTAEGASDSADHYGAALASALVAELRVMREELMRLSREVGRLETQVAQGQNGQSRGQRACVLARLRPWLRR